MRARVMTRAACLPAWTKLLGAVVLVSGEVDAVIGHDGLRGGEMPKPAPVNHQ